MRTPFFLCLSIAACASTPKAEPDAFRLRASVPSAGEPLAFALEQSLGIRMTGDHRVEWQNNGAVFDAIVEEVARAEKSIHIVMYIWEAGSASDRVLKALGARKKDVACRILIDQLGSPKFQETLEPPLEAIGCEVRIFRPEGEKLARNHRKILLFDGSTAIVGGFGVRDDWLGDGVHDKKWRDANVRFSGSAVADAQQAFAENWQEAGGALLPRETFQRTQSATTAAAFLGSTCSFVTRAERITQILIAAATNRLWISNAYFVPTRAILEALCQKAKSGLDVRVLTSGKQSDSKTSFFAQNVEYDRLRQCGIRLWEYLPSMLHTKTMLIDEHLVLVGSINLEPLSLTRLEESALVVENRGLAARLAEDFTGDCAHAKEIKD